MRGVLQLRTPESGNGNQHKTGGLNASVVEPKVRFREPQIEMAHGAGGKASRRLVEGLFAPLFFGSGSEILSDAAQLPIGDARIAITTDSFVVKPIRFPGGSIAELRSEEHTSELQSHVNLVCR